MKKHLVRAAMLAAIFCSAKAALFQWTVESGGNGHWYEPVAVGSLISWEDAQTASSMLGGYLATTTTASENNFVFSLIDSAGFWRVEGGHSAGPWLGGFQPDGSAEPDGGWTWLNGEGAFSYSAWGPGEPGNFLPEFMGGEDSLQYFVFEGNGSRSPFWGDAHGTPFATSYVVEYDTAPVPEPETYAVIGLSIAGIVSIVRRRLAR